MLLTKKDGRGANLSIGISHPFLVQFKRTKTNSHLWYDTRNNCTKTLIQGPEWFVSNDFCSYTEKTKRFALLKWLISDPCHHVSHTHTHTCARWSTYTSTSGSTLCQLHSDFNGIKRMASTCLHEASSTTCNEMGEKRSLLFAVAVFAHCV